MNLPVSLRRLLRNPFYTLLACLLLGLGVGATTGLYSSVDAVLLRALPLPQPERLVVLWVDATARGFNQRDVSNPADIASWREGLPQFDEIAGYIAWQPDLTGNGEPERLFAAQVTEAYFRVLGLPLALGRDFVAAEDRPGGARVVVLSHAYWQQRMGGDPGVLGQTVNLDGQAHEIIGVAAAGLRAPGLQNAALWRPFQSDPQDRGGFFMNAIGRLGEGVALSTAAAAFDRLQQQLGQRFPDSNRDLRGHLEPLAEVQAAGLRTQLWVLFAATWAVLLVALAILLNLALARMSRDRREWALHAVLGADRSRLLRLALAEGCWLGLASALLALPLAWAILRWLGSVIAANAVGVARLPQLDLRVLAFGLLLCLLGAIVASLLPWWLTGRREMTGALRDDDRGSAGSRGAARLRAGLVVSTFAMAMLLTVGAGLFLSSLQKLRELSPGFQPAGLLTFTLALNEQRYADGEALRAAARRLRERLDEVPGVAVSGLTSTLPLANMVSDATVLPEGGEADGVRAFFSKVSPGYLSALGAPLLRGRDLVAADDREGPCVVLANQRFVDQHFAAGDPLGRRVTLNHQAAEPIHCELVGVVGDMRFANLATPQQPTLYLPLHRFADRFLFVAVRSEGEPLALLPALRQAIAEVDPQLALGSPQSMTALVDASMQNERTLASLSSAFALATLLLATLGVYGMLAYSVSQRRRELGVRAALGADARRLTTEVVGSGLRLALGGIGIGAILVGLCASTMSSLLYQTQPLEPSVLLVVALLLAGLALLATLPPALRVARTAPVVALRGE